VIHPSSSFYEEATVSLFWGCTNLALSSVWRCTLATITGPQIRKIWAASREVGWDECDLRHAVECLTGSSKISSLTKEQAIDVIDYLEAAKGARSVRPGMASAKQLWLIHDLASQLGWTDEHRLRGYLRKYAKVESAQWLTLQAASNIIQGLKAMLKRQAVNS
jgi:hypothetical protein